MHQQRRHVFISLSVTMILSLVLSLTQPLTVSASHSEQASDGLKRDYNTQTGKVTLISPSSSERMSAAEVLGVSALSESANADPVMALAEHFAPEFGLQGASHNLKETRVNHAEGGRKSVHYQQTYQGIPILAGELIVNTDDQYQAIYA
jgi:Zn-dependent metalloprotease